MLDLFVVIGPPKCGTTWIHQVLQQHPDVAVSSSKELFYFNGGSWDRGPEWYWQQFDKSPDSSVYVEVCHEYLMAPEAAVRIGECPNVNSVIAIARNPLERAVSAYLYLRKQGRTSLSFEKALRQFDELVDHARYMGHLRPYIVELGVERVHLLDFETLQRSPEQLRVSLASILGIDADKFGPIPGKALPAAKSRIPTLTAALRLVGHSVRRVGGHRLVSRMKSSSTVRRALYTELEASDIPATEGLHDFVYGKLAADVQELDRTFGTDFERQWFRPEQQTL